MSHDHGTTADVSMTDMSGMTDGHSHVNGMTMIFFNAIDTSLYSSSWTPSSTAAYAGTCIFLVILAVVLRGLLALKALQEARWLDAELKRRYVVVNGKAGLAERLSQDSTAKNMVVSENGVEENVMVVERRHGVQRPWRLSVDPLRALMDVVITGVGYLLMLAVMTMNIGYFLSVLGGVFLGSLAVGRYTVASEH